MGSNTFDPRQLVVIAEVTHSFAVSHNGFSPVLPNSYTTPLKSLDGCRVQVRDLCLLRVGSGLRFRCLQATGELRQY